MASASDEENHDRTRRYGICILTKVDRLTENGQKIPIAWNMKKQPIGDYASLVQFFISYHTRRRVSIGISRWKDVPKETKNLIFEAVKEKFDVNESNRRLVMLSASKKWSDFKHGLTSGYLFTNEDQTQIRTEPPKLYPFIDKDTWAEFIRQRCSSEFRLREQGLDPTTSCLPRCELWMLGRQSYGLYDREVMEVVRSIGSLKEKVSQGKISLEGREDILALALGKEEHVGRVRGVGAGVGLKRCFPDSRRGISNAVSEMRINELQEKLDILQQENASRDRLLEQMKSQLEFFQKNWKGTNEEPPPVQVPLPSDNDSCSKTNSPLVDPPMEKWERCQLFWPDLNSLVAKGRAIVPTSGKVSMLHCRPLGLDQLKIIVDEPLMPTSSVPYPTEEVSSVLQAKGSPVAWPKGLVNIVSVKYQNSNGKRPPLKHKHTDESLQRHKQHATTLEKYRTHYPTMDDTFLITVEVGDNIFSFPQQLYIDKDQIRVWLQNGAIDNVHVALYIKYLYESRRSNIYAFFCPTYLAADCKDSEEKKEQYMADSMSKLEKKNNIWFAPYNEDFHWMLAVINPWDNTVYWLDQLRKSVLDKFRVIVDTAIMMFSVQQNTTNRKKTRWLTIACPQQEVNTLDCGYYVCRYMREIMDHQCTVIPINYLKGSPPCYSAHLVDDLRDEWLQYLDTQSP